MTLHTTRRQILGVTGSTAIGALAGCIGNDDDQAVGHGEEHVAEEQVSAYIVAYHWGYAVFDENGNEHEILEATPNTELTIHAVNDHAYDAFDALPEPVREQLEEFDALGRTQQKVEAGILPEPEGHTVEEVYGMTHGHAHEDDGHDDDHGHEDDGHDDDHGHEDDGHDDDHGHEDDGHDDDLLDHGFIIPDFDVQFEVPAHSSEPITETILLDEPGTYNVACTVTCGYYHSQQTQELIRVTE